MLPNHQRLGDFEIIRLLGRGGMGEVYEAQQFNPPRRVALKVLAPWLAGDDLALERFLRESAVPARLDHPSIVRIISTGRTEEGLAYYTMNLVRGLSLAQIMKAAQVATASEPPTVARPTNPDSRLPHDETPSEGKPPPGLPLEPTGEHDPPAVHAYRADRYRFLVRFGLQAARALAWAHRQGVLHRDIKPSNLMIDHHDHLYLLDFGLTRALHGDGTGTSPGRVCGTPWYMSPEQVRGERIDARSDLYALGVTLYELATGGLGPFTASRQESEAVLAQVRSGQILPLRTLAPDVPAAMEKMIQKAMHFKPDRRYSSADELAYALEQVASELNDKGSAKPPKPPRHSWLWPAAALGLVGLAAVAFVLRPGSTAKPEVAPGPVEPQPVVVANPHPPASPGGLPPLPEDMLKRTFNLQVPLLLGDTRPRYAHLLCGDGHFDSLVRCMSVYSQISAPRPYLLALDNDPERRPFEFSVEMKPTRLSQIPLEPLRDSIGAAACPLGFGPLLASLTLAEVDSRQPINGAPYGVFFGWHRNPHDPEQRCYHFVLRFTETGTTQAKPRMEVVLECYEEGKPPRGTHYSAGHLANPEQMTMTLDPLPPDGWRRLRVKAIDDKVEITVDKHRPFAFAVPELKVAPSSVRSGLSPRGALGIWVRRGFVLYRQAFVTALAPEEK